MFGSTIKSESAFYLVQDIESAQFSGSEPTEYYWHSTQKPRPLAETITSNPIWFIGHLTKGILLVIRNFFLSGPSHSQRCILFLIMLAAAVVPAIKLQRWRNFIPELAFVSLYAGALIVVFGVRGAHLRNTIW